MADCMVSHMTKNSVMATKEEMVREFRVREILAAACRIVARHGFQGATVDRVAEEARVAKGTIYLYFHDKEELLKAAVEQTIEHFIHQVQAEVTEFPTPMEKLRRLFEASLELSETDRDFFKTLLLERNFLAAAPNRSDTAPMVGRYLDHIHFIEEIIAEGVRTGSLRPHNVEVSACMLYETIRGCFQQRVLGLTSRLASESADVFLDLFLHGIGNHTHKE